MAEFSLEGWTAAERESLSFLLDDAEITALWGPNTVEVPEESADRVRRFVAFLNNKYDASLEAEESFRPTHDVSIAGLGLPVADTHYFDVAGPWLRFRGWFVDLLVFLPITVFAYAIGTEQFSGLYWLQFAIGVAYEILMVGLLGRTLGNMAVRTRVVTETGRAIPGLRAGCIRWFVPQAVPLLLLPFPDLIGVELIWGVIVFGPILRGPSHRGLHDRASGVMVVDDRLARVRPSPMASPDVA